MTTCTSPREPNPSEGSQIHTLTVSMISFWHTSVLLVTQLFAGSPKVWNSWAEIKQSLQRKTPTDTAGLMSIPIDWNSSYSRNGLKQLPTSSRRIFPENGSVLSGTSGQSDKNPHNASSNANVPILLDVQQQRPEHLKRSSFVPCKETSLV